MDDIESIGSAHDRRLREQIDPLCAMLTPTGKAELAFRLFADSIAGRGPRGIVGSLLRGRETVVEGGTVRRLPLALEEHTHETER